MSEFVLFTVGGCVGGAAVALFRTAYVEQLERENTTLRTELLLEKERRK